jgi:hypothetical protein
VITGAHDVETRQASGGSDRGILRVRVTVNVLMFDPAKRAKHDSCNWALAE